CIADGIFPEKGGQEIDVDIDNNPERKNQQGGQQKKEFYTDRIANANHAIKHNRISHNLWAKVTLS
ncbi:MAG: hypothetical protein ABIJ25_09700, partial [Pseudomonadota bacterium]